MNMRELTPEMVNEWLDTEDVEAMREILYDMALKRYYVEHLIADIIDYREEK